MSGQHLSDEAIAAFADGFLGGHARDRATKHVNSCEECRYAVAVQREAAWALRVAAAPSLPSDLANRLRMLPQTTTLSPLPTVLGPDGAPMLVASPPARPGGDPLSGFPLHFGAIAPAVPVPSSAVPARAVPAPPVPAGAAHGRLPVRYVRPIATAAAMLALAGTLATGSVADAAQSTPHRPQTPSVPESGPGTSAGAGAGADGSSTGTQVATFTPQQFVASLTGVFHPLSGVRHPAR